MERGSLVGHVLRDTYRLIRPIKAGGMGEVYEAQNVRLPNLRYAVKVLDTSVTGAAEDESTSYARFRREAEIISGLRHPNIVTVLDFDRTSEGHAFLVMELLEGEDLARRLKRQGPLGAAEVAEILQQVGAALQVAHDRGVVHRDLKPSNIFLERKLDGASVARLLDFGISKDLGSKVAVTLQLQVVMGTTPYMAPEQARGDIAKVDQTSDIFSLATVAYVCLSGKRPFTGSDDSAVRESICNEPAPPVDALAPGLPPEVATVLARAHAKEKTDRYQRVEHFVRDLTVALTGQAPEPTAGADTPWFRGGTDSLAVTLPLGLSADEGTTATRSDESGVSGASQTAPVKRGLGPWPVVATVVGMLALGATGTLVLLDEETPPAPTRPDAATPRAVAPDSAPPAPDRRQPGAAAGAPDLGADLRPRPVRGRHPAPARTTKKKQDKKDRKLLYYEDI